MRLPESSAAAYGINPETEYDVMFRMPPERLSQALNRLAKMETQTFVIAAGSFEGVESVTFMKELPDLNLSGGSDDGEFNARIMAQGDHNFSILMENRIREAGIQKAFCMKCLLGNVEKYTVDRFGMEATDVTMYMGTNVPTFMVYTFPASDTRAYIAPVAKHVYHKESIKDAAARNNAMLSKNEAAAGPSQVVENQKRERDEDGDGNEVNVEDKKPKLNPEDGDGKGGDEEGIPKDGEPKLSG